MGGVTQQEKDIDREKALQEKLKPKNTSTESGISEAGDNQPAGPKTLVNRIDILGNTILGENQIKTITARYEGRELSMKDMQTVANLLTDEYRKEGYATSRAYIPPQTIKGGVLTIRVVEGKLGQVTIEGNKYFSTRLLRNRIGLQENGYFDYSALQQSLVYINESPDHKARATLAPGKEPGTTDVVITVADQLPIHAGFQYDNYGSDYINRNRYTWTLEHNNLLGFDDKLFLKYQRADDSRLILRQGRYLFPVNKTFELGVYGLKSKLRLGKDMQIVDARGSAELYGAFATKILVQKNNFDLRWTVGFDYKKIRNFQLSAQTSRDAVRIAKTGLDMDVVDHYGRNIIIPEVQVGIPDIMGGMKAKNDPQCSRTGAGARFTKGLLTYYRVQKMPLETSLLWKNYFQYTNDRLVASEQFQIGGATSVRGYPVGEHTGDNGLYTSPELSIPFYFLNRAWTIPHRKETWYDTTRAVVFYDFGFTSFNGGGLSNESKTHTLRAVGFGFRFTLGDSMTLRVEVGYPLGAMPSDGDHAHPWVEFTSKF